MSFINNFNQLDILILILTIVSMVYGYTRGLIKEILSILSIIISGYSSIILYPEISNNIKKYIDMALLADSISFAVLFLLTYSIINVLINFVVSTISKTPLKIFDKNFGILFGFFRSLLIFSFLNILLTWIIWKNNVPSWVNDSKAIVLIDYTSKKLIEILPEDSLIKIEETFNISLDNKINNLLINENSIEKYNEPTINKSQSKNSKGYSDNDNDSLDKLFNIESNN